MTPNPAFRRPWEKLDATLDARKACRVYVGLLHLAMMHACEALLAIHLDDVIDGGDTPDLERARNAVAPPSSPRMPVISIAVPDPAIYDRLLEAGIIASHQVPANEEIPS